MKIVKLTAKVLFPVVLSAGIVLGLNAGTARASAAQHFAILAEAMRPLDTTIGINNTSAYLVTAQNSSLSASTAYIAQVNLPDGAVVTGVHVYGVDSDASLNAGAALYRYSLDTDPVWGPKAVANFSTSSGSAGKFTINLTVNADTATIDNANFSYGVYIDLPKATVYNPASPSLGVLRVVIDWGYATFLPVTVMK